MQLIDNKISLSSTDIAAIVEDIHNGFEEGTIEYEDNNIVVRVTAQFEEAGYPTYGGGDEYGNYERLWEHLYYYDAHDIEVEVLTPQDYDIDDKSYKHLVAAFVQHGRWYD